MARRIGQNERKTAEFNRKNWKRWKRTKNYY
jgi:hypothetical protein